MMRKKKAPRSRSSSLSFSLFSAAAVSFHQPRVLLVLAVVACLVLKPNNSNNGGFALASTAAGTETLIGIVGEDFVLMGADSSVGGGGIAFSATLQDKIAVLVDPKYPKKALPDDDDGNGNEKRSDGDGIAGSGVDSDGSHSNSLLFRQQAVVAAAAGDAADSDRLLGALAAEAAVSEYEASVVGCDVEVVDFGGAATAEGPPPPPPLLLRGGMSAEDAAQLARSQLAKKRLRVCLLLAGMVPAAVGWEEEEEGEGPPPSAAGGEDEGRATGSGRRIQSPSDQVQRQVWRAANSYWGEPAAVYPEGEDAEVDKKVGEKAKSYSSTNGNVGDRYRLQPRLYWLDEYGMLQGVQYGSHGYASNFCLSVLDASYKSNLTRRQAVKLMRDCFAQLRHRYVINNSARPCIKCVDADGCRIVRDDEIE